MPGIKPQFLKLEPHMRTIAGAAVSASDQLIASLMSERVRQAQPAPRAYGAIVFHDGAIGPEIRDKVQAAFDVLVDDNPEAYVIEAAGDTIDVYGNSPAALFFAYQTLCQSLVDDSLQQVLAYDYPVLPWRGMKVYLPGPEALDYFREFVDMMAYYKHNTIMLEVGGAMEYKRHPEINQKWVEYCDFMKEYSGKTIKIQEHSFPWLKNSIHVENGDGQFLSQETVRELVAYCKERHIRVIPEVPCLSHCDYLVMAHPEIAERPYDPYPDTYCPSNPKSYELLFDIMEEIIDVFEPTLMHIGHDEYYSVGKCELCRSKKPEEIYANDIKKIMAFLAERDIETMIWGEKLLSQGGHARNTYLSYDEEHGAFLEVMPEVKRCKELLPKELKILHWYWFRPQLEKELFEAGFEVTLGNFHGSQFGNWKERMAQGFTGGMTSNWSTLKEINMQRNLILFDVAFQGMAFWNRDYDDPLYPQTVRAAFEDLYHYKYAHTGDWKGVPASERIEVVHTTDYIVPYRIFADGVFIEEDKYKLGDYVLDYADGDSARVPVIFGTCISNCGVEWQPAARHLCEIAYTSCPVRMGEKTWYKWTFRNPRPGQQPIGVRFESAGEKFGQVLLHSARIGLE